MEHQGLFSRALLDIEIQLDDLITKAGGLEGVRLLDKLSALPESARREMISHFLRLLDENETGNFEPPVVRRVVGRLGVINGGRRVG
jgi:hypothetical protein